MTSKGAIGWGLGTNQVMDPNLMRHWNRIVPFSKLTWLACWKNPHRKKNTSSWWWIFQPGVCQFLVEGINFLSFWGDATQCKYVIFEWFPFSLFGFRISSIKTNQKPSCFTSSRQATSVSMPMWPGEGLTFITYHRNAAHLFVLAFLHLRGSKKGYPGWLFYMMKNYPVI